MHYDIQSDIFDCRKDEENVCVCFLFLFQCHYSLKRAAIILGIGTDFVFEIEPDEKFDLRREEVIRNNVFLSVVVFSSKKWKGRFAAVNNVD